MLWNTQEEMLRLCSNLKCKGSCILPRVATLCIVDHLDQGDVILQLLKVSTSAERSVMLAMILSTPKL